MTQSKNLYWNCYDTRILGFNNDFICLPQGTPIKIYQGDNLMADLLITKDSNGVPCVFEKKLGKYFYWGNKDAK